jgi:CMP-N,N'-diacetyllegionaminic acid synthase
MTTYAIIPARAGSKGIRCKNIRLLNGVPLMGYSISFARQLPVDRIFCSTDSPEFAETAKKLGAEVPFLRSDFAAGDTAMEEDILADLYPKFEEHGIPIPDLLVWLRPTFVFRSVEIATRCIQRMSDDPSLSACRTVCESESRLYTDNGGLLVPGFDDHGGRSMIRRQDVQPAYKVYSLDVFRSSGRDTSPYFLGKKIGYEILPKMCGLDIDDENDWDFVEHILRNRPATVAEYIHV